MMSSMRFFSTPASLSSSSSEEREEVEESGWVSLTSVAIQWHISLHSGLSRDGASGSVRARVSWGCFLPLPEFQRVESGSRLISWTSGCFLVFEGLIVLP